MIDIVSVNPDDTVRSLQPDNLITGTDLEELIAINIDDDVNKNSGGIFVDEVTSTTAEFDYGDMVITFEQKFGTGELDVVLAAYNTIFTHMPLLNGLGFAKIQGADNFFEDVNGFDGGVVYSRADTHDDASYTDNQNIVRFAPFLTNEALHSEDFEDVFWFNFANLVTATLLDPFGSNNGHQYTSAANLAGPALQNHVVTADTDYLMSCYIKESTSPTFTLQVLKGATFAAHSNILYTWTNGVPVPTVPTVVGQDNFGVPLFVEELSNDWFRITASVPTKDQTQFGVVFFGIVSQIGDDFILWGIQFEKRKDVSRPSLYKKTVATTVGKAEPRYPGNGMYLEGPSQNLIDESEDVTTWTQNSSPVVSVNLPGSAPDGISRSHTVTSTIPGSNVDIEATIVSTVSVPIAYSLFLKDDGSNTDGRIQCFSINGALAFSGDFSFDELGNLEFIQPVPGTQPKVIALANGWFRVVIDELNSSSGTNGNRIRVIVDITIGTRACEVWGAMIEDDKLDASEYIRSVGSNVTRSQEFLGIPPANMPADQDMSVGITSVATNSGLDFQFLWNVNMGTSTGVAQRQDDTGMLFIYRTTEENFLGNFFGISTRSVLAYSKTNSLMDNYIDGVKDVDAPTTVLPTTNVPTVFNIGLGATGIRPFYGVISELRVYSTKLSDEQVAKELSANTPNTLASLNLGLV